MTTAVLPDRKPGTRCCDREAKPLVRTREAQQLADDMQILAHPVRLQILDILARNGGRVCVCDIDGAVAVKQPTVSHHLKLLRDADLIDSERQGLWAYYFIKRDGLNALTSRIQTYLEAIR